MRIIIGIFFFLVICYALKRECAIRCSRSSPLVFVLGANFFVLSLYFLTQDVLGFHALCWNTVFYLLFGVAVFSIVSLLFTSIVRCKIPNEIISWKYVSEEPSKLFFVVTTFTCVFMLYKIFSLGLSDIIANEQKASEYGGENLSGHILVLQIFLLSHLLSRKIKLKYLPFLLGLLFCLYVYNVKAWVIVPFLLAFMSRFYMGGILIKPLKLVLIAGAVFILFAISYFITLGWTFDNMSFIWAHFCKYLFAGIGGMNEALLRNYPIATCPNANLPSFINVIFGINAKIPNIYDYMIINDVTHEWTNILSLFGSIFLINGHIVGVVYIFVIAIISYILYFIRLFTKNYWLSLGYYIWSIGLVLSFFGNYYKLLNLWELTLWALVIGHYLPRKINIKPYKITI